MHLHTVVPCVHYDDFLALTLPGNLTVLDRVTVLTHGDDHATIALARQHRVPVFLSDAWHIGGPFNKARALNEWIAYATAQYPGDWLLSLDADTLLAAPVAPVLPQLDPAGLYGVRRRLCDNPEAYAGLLAGGVPFGSLPLDTIPIADGKLWGFAPTTNPAGLAGYFQLWCPQHAAGASRLNESGSAEHYDYQFGLSFPEGLRAYLDLPDALHLGPNAVNWNGRSSPRWQLAPEPPVPESRALEPRTLESRAPGPRAPDSRAPDSQAPDPRPAAVARRALHHRNRR